MARRFIFRNAVTPSREQGASHPSGFAVVASEKRQKTPSEKMAETTQADIHDAREWLKRVGADEAVAMFDASVK